MKDLYKKGRWVEYRESPKESALSGGNTQSTVTTPDHEGAGEGHEIELSRKTGWLLTFDWWRDSAGQWQPRVGR